MATTRCIFTPESAHFPSTNFGALTTINQRPALAFDTTTAETVYWTFVAPQGLTGALSVVITWSANIASGTVGWIAALEVPTSSEDLDAGTYFATGNTGTAVTVPATIGFATQMTITLTNNDSIAAGNYARLSIQRDTANDSANADAYIYAVELREA